MEETPEPDAPRSRRNAALELAFNIGPAFAGMLCLGWLVGTWIDQRFGTAPTGLSLCVLLGAVVGFIYVIGVAKRLE